MTSHERIHIERIRTRGILGVDEWEREHRQDIFVSLTMRVDLEDVLQSDRVEDTVNYRTLTKDVRAHVEQSERRTVEVLASEIADLCLNREKVVQVTSRVEKPDALRGTDGVSVEVTRPKN